MARNKSAIAILIEGTEETELVSSVNVMRRAGIDVTIAGHDGTGKVKCSHGVTICPDSSLDEAIKKDYDVVFIPGGPGYKKLTQSALMKELLTKQESRNGIIAAICAAPVVLKAHKIGLNKTITSYPSVKNELTADKLYKYSEEKVVVDGNVITSRGPGTAVDIGLTIVQEVLGQDARVKVATEILYS